MTVPIFHLFKLQITAEKRENFVAVGKRNLQTSRNNELGTLAMFTSHVDPAGLDNRVLEVYRDAESYQTHVHSPQFAAFRSVAKRAVVQQSVENLAPKLLLTKPQPLELIPATTVFSQLTTLTIRSGQTAAYQAAVVPYLQAAMAAETGLVMAAVGQVVGDSQQWGVFTLHQDLPAFKRHCQTANYKTYRAAAQPLIQQADATVLTGDALVSQGGLDFVPRFN